MLASGRGSNVQNFINYFRNNPNIEIALIISDNPNAYVHKRAEKENIPSLTIERPNWENKKQIINIFKQYKIDFIVLAGFLSMIPDFLISAYKDRIVNIHPALLPKYGGKGMYGMKVHKAVIAAKEKESGISIHHVNEKYDEGKIIFQESCEIWDTDTAESLSEKVQLLEYKNYPDIVEKMALNIK
ncbi:MAG: phosphoribosylglycinamide formyltransferase [Bacteroidota bacterium]